MDLLVGWLEQVTGYTYLAPPNKHSRNMTFAINLPTCTIKSELFTVVKIPLKTNPRLYYQPKRATTLLKGLKLTMVINHLLKEQKQKKTNPRILTDFWSQQWTFNSHDFPFSNRWFTNKNKSKMAKQHPEASEIHGIPSSSDTEPLLRDWPSSRVCDCRWPDRDQDAAQMCCSLEL